MKRTPVISRALKSIGYDPIKNLLEIEILSTRKIYAYFDVPVAIYIEFMKAASLGEYYNAIIKKFSFKEITDESNHSFFGKYGKRKPGNLFSNRAFG